MCLRVEGTLRQSQIHLWALEPLLTLACMDGVLKHPVQAKWHIQRILPGRSQYFLGKACGRKQTVQRREERNIHCAFPSSSAPNTSATIVTIHTVLLHHEVFISVYLRYPSGLYRRSPEFSWNRMKLRLCYSCLVYRNKSKNQNIVCEFIPMTTSPSNYERGSKMLFRHWNDCSLLCDHIRLFYRLRGNGQNECLSI